jgi:pimeloyl-ACP methyl ester carboxylesterase
MALYHERHGAGEPLLLITGWTISAAVFEPVIEAYAEHFECIAYDHRGSARSGGSPPTSMAALADAAASLLTALRIPRAHVYGVSMGGMVAQELALRHPDRVCGLVLGGTTPGGPFAPRLGPGDVLAIARGGMEERGLRGPLLFSPGFRREQPERVRELVRYFTAHRSSVAAIGAQTFASATFSAVSRLGRLRAPTLVMHGECDRLVPLAASKLLAARIPGAELAVVPGAGHAYALEAPQESLDLLLDWRERRLSRSRPREEAHVAPD